MIPLVTCLVCFFAPVIPSRNFPADKQTDFLPATVRIHNRELTSFGSGAIIGEKGKDLYILSAFHVVQTMQMVEIDFFGWEESPKGRQLQMLVAKKEKTENNSLDFSRVASIRLRDEPTDLVLLIVTKPDYWNARPFSLAKSTIEHPAKRKVVLSIGCNDGLLPSCREDLVQTKRLIFRGMEPKGFFWETMQETYPGRSGGPLLDTTGQIVGVASSRQKGLGYYTHLDEIESFLKKGGFDWLCSPPTVRMP